MSRQLHQNGITRSTAVAIVLAAVASLVSQAYGHETTSPVTATDTTLWENLGTLHYDITTTNPEAQQFFDQGLRLAYAFNHEAARRAFHHAQELDPNCALCYWGEAYVLGPNINWPMNPEAVELAHEAVAKAKAATNTSPKEQALIAALAVRYSDDPNADRPALDAAYGEAMVKVAAAYPDDHEIVVLTAEALMDTQPWDYWTVSETGAKVGKGHAGEIIALLEKVLEADSNHPGAIHLYIHMMENSDTPEEAEPYANRLAALMPGAGHLVHMGSHIFYRIGRFSDSIRDNEAAAAVDEAYFANANDEEDNDFYHQSYYAHNVHFVLVSAQMAGNAATTLATAEKLASVVTEEGASTIAFVQPIMLAPYWAHAQYSSPETILALADPGDKFPFVRGMWHYARGVAFAQNGDLASAAAEVDAIDALANEADLSFLTNSFVPADQLLQIARHVVQARIAHTKGYDNTAIDEFQRAVALQDALAYMEPPFWYYPVRQSLGAALLNAGRTDEAVTVFEAGLRQSPNNGWILYGLAQAQKKLGDDASAKATEAALAKAWMGPLDLLDLSRL